MSKVNCYIDFEFTTTGKKSIDFRKNAIELLSIGCVFVNQNGKIVDEFYEVIKPVKNIKLTTYCKGLTKISQEEVNSARDFEQVISDLQKMINKYSKVKFYNWGTFDVIAFRKTIKINKYKGDFKRVINSMQDLQPIVSSKIKYDNITVTSRWGLQKVKLIYGLEIGENVHNALFDARDLYQVHMCHKLNKVQNLDVIQKFIEKDNSPLKSVI